MLFFLYPKFAKSSLQMQKYYYILNQPKKVGKFFYEEKIGIFDHSY